MNSFPADILKLRILRLFLLVIFLFLFLFALLFFGLVCPDVQIKLDSSLLLLIELLGNDCEPILFKAAFLVNLENFCVQVLDLFFHGAHHFVVLVDQTLSLLKVHFILHEHLF